MQNFVRVCIADAADVARICERALQGMILGGERRAERFGSGFEHLNSTGVQRLESSFALNDVQRSPAFGARLGQGEGATFEIKRGQVLAAGKLDARGLPMKTSGNHEVNDKPYIIFEADGDALPDSFKTCDGLIFGCRRRRRDGAQKKRSCDADMQQLLIEYARVERSEVGFDVWQLRHEGYFMSRETIEWILAMDEQEFKNESSRAMETLFKKLSAATEEYDFEPDFNAGALSIEFEEPKAKFVVSPNAPVKQIWVSAHSKSFKLDWDAAQRAFVLPATGETLDEMIAGAISKHLNEEVTL